MRIIIGWMAALFASALLGAVVYETVLSQPVQEPEASAYTETAPRNPQPGATVYRTEVRRVVEPTPRVTVIEEVAVPAAPAARDGRDDSERADSEDREDHKTEKSEDHSSDNAEDPHDD